MKLFLLPMPVHILKFATSQLYSIHGKKNVDKNKWTFSFFQSSPKDMFDCRQGEGERKRGKH